MGGGGRRFTRIRLLCALMLWLGGTALPAGEGSRRVTAGDWGGDHVRMAVSDAGARLEFDCAHGIVAEALTLDDRGRFAAKGRFTREHGGPTRKDEADSGVSARYQGSVEASELTLEIALESGETVGPFHLTLGGRARIVKCR